VRSTLLVLTVALPLGGCGWLGWGHKDTDKPAEAAAPAPAGPALSSDEILQKDCADEKWKQQNLGLWYSVCRQPMRW
jgi:hypothetical protein